MALADTVEEVPSPPLMTRRRLLGLMIPAFNLPLFGWNLYTLVAKVQEGMNPNSTAFLEELFVTFSALFLALLLPRYFPVYTSKVRLEPAGLTLSRFMKAKTTLPYKEIDRADVYIRVDEEISPDANSYAIDQAAALRKSGFKFKDYTNSEDTIMNLYVGKDIYMISPLKPRSLLKELRKRNGRFTARIVELTRRGKSIQDLGKQ
jgi:hypothetical protein